MVLDGEERRRRSRRIETGVNRQSERRPPFGCCDQQWWGWNASQIIGPVVELEGHGLVEEKHSVSPHCLSRPTVCQFRWLTSNADRYHVSARQVIYLLDPEGC